MRSGNCPDKAMPPASSPTKCGANRMVDWPSRSAATSPTMCKRRRNNAGLPCQSQMRSRKVCMKRTKCSRAMRSRSASVLSGKHRRRLTSATLRRLDTSCQASLPSSQPRPRQTHSGNQASTPNTRLSRRTCQPSASSAWVATFPGVLSLTVAAPPVPPAWRRNRPSHRGPDNGRNPTCTAPGNAGSRAPSRG